MAGGRSTSDFAPRRQPGVPAAEAWPVVCEAARKTRSLAAARRVHDAVRGLFSSWAKPPIICPIAAKRSLWMICCSSFLFQGNVSHRDDHAIHFIVGIEQRALPLPAWCASFPSRCRAPYSLKPNFLRPVLTSDRARLARESGPADLRASFPEKSSGW